MSFSSILFTSTGYTLQAKAQLGTPIVFTKIALGNGKLTGQVIQELKGLIQPKKEVVLGKFELGENGTATVAGTLNNQDMEQGFYWREIGLYAQDPDDTGREILYCYGYAGDLAEYIPAGGESQILEKRIQITAIIGNATHVSAQIDRSALFVTHPELESEVLALNQSISLLDKQIKDLSSPYVIGEDEELPISQRVKGKMYFKVTSVQNCGVNNEIKVSPNMGIKII